VGIAMGRKRILIDKCDPIFHTFKGVEDFGD
jgi:hypothetical protein